MNIDTLQPHDLNEDPKNERDVSWEEISLSLAGMSLPLIVSYLLRLTEIFMLLYFAGHITRQTDGDSTVFAGISMALMFVNVSCTSSFTGMASAMDTLGSQYNGSGRYKEVGIVLQTAIIVLVLMTIPISVIWLFAGDIFIYIGVDKDICDVLISYLRVIVVNIPAIIVLVTYRKFLVCLGITQTLMYTFLMLDVVLFVSCYVLVIQWNGGLHALAAASIISTYSAVLFLVVHSYFHPFVQRSLCCPTLKAFDGVVAFVILGVPGCIMTCSEWWAYEFLTLFASRLGSEEVTSQSLMYQLSNFGFMIPSSLAAATSSIVGNLIGAGELGAAIKASKCCLSITLCIIVVFITPTITFGGNYFVSLFSDDATVRRLCAATIPVMAALSVTDGLQAVASGVLRAAGKQYFGATVNVLCFYVIGLPLAWVFCFTFDWQVAGLMLGILCASVVQSTTLLSTVLCVQGYIFRSRVQASVLDSGAGSYVQTSVVDIDGLDDEAVGEIALSVVNPVNSANTV